MKAVSVDIAGVRYASIRAAARGLGVCASTLYAARARGCLDDMLADIVRRGGVRPTARAVVIDGVRYPSKVAACAAFGISKDRLNAWLARGGVSLPSRSVRFVPVVVNGVRYPSKAAACAALGVGYRTLRRICAQGRSDRPVRPRRRVVRAAAADRAPAPAPRGDGPGFFVGPHRFACARDASVRLGFEDPDFISRAVRARDADAVQRILGAAMAYGVGGAASWVIVCRLAVDILNVFVCLMGVCLGSLCPRVRMAPRMRQVCVVCV